ncbi:hypothetical protein ILYODFUR_019062 [Ilyodon furcidens]|uniref:Uncharacterized protein n=1 Tax=Ilyodon furcidens TaxID=33524 RepID=A0ABV0U6X8_9TELE
MEAYSWFEIKNLVKNMLSIHVDLKTNMHIFITSDSYYNGLMYLSVLELSKLDKKSHIEIHGTTKSKIVPVSCSQWARGGIHPGQIASLSQCNTGHTLSPEDIFEGPIGHMHA